MSGDTLADPVTIEPWAALKERYALPETWKPQFRQARYGPWESDEYSTVPVWQRGQARK